MKLSIEDIISNFCTDLLSLSENEWFLKCLLKNNKGQWLAIAEAYSINGKDLPEDIKIREELFSVWLDDPLGDNDFVTIFFYDVELGWNLSASYNQNRLLKLIGGSRG